MATRYEVEKSFVSVLEAGGMENVRRTISSGLRAYPIIIVEMESEEKEVPVLSSNITVQTSLVTLLQEGWESFHYDLFGKILNILSVENGLMNKLESVGLNVPWVMSTTDRGTIEIEDDNKMPMAQTTAVTSLTVI